MTDSGQGDGGGDSSGSGGSDGSNGSSDSTGGGGGGDAGVGNDGASTDGMAGTGDAGMDGQGENGVAGGDGDGPPGLASDGAETADDRASFQGPATLQTQNVSPSLLSGLRGLTREDVKQGDAVTSIALGLMTAAMPAVGILSALTDMARALGFAEEPTSFADNPEGAGTPDAATSFQGPVGGAAIPTVTVNPPVFLTAGSSSLPAAASSFTTPQALSGDSSAGSGSQTGGEGSETLPIWPVIAAAALLALGAAA